MPDDLFARYYFQAFNGKPMECPTKSLEAYFQTIEKLFGLNHEQAEKALAAAALHCDRASFWRQRLQPRQFPETEIPRRMLQ